MKTSGIVVLLSSVALGLAGGACSGTTTVSGSPAAGDDGGVPGAGGNVQGDGGEQVTDGGGKNEGDGATVTPTGGCGAAGVAAGVQSKTTKVAASDRHYQVVVPSGYDTNRPLDLVFVFHGLRGDGNQIRSYFNLEGHADGKALFVYPDGLPQAQAGGATAWDVSDLAFFDAMRTEISAAYCVDSSRIFAAGHSYGGFMTNLVGCARGDVVRAIAPVSGGLAVGAGACKGPVAAWIAHGDADRTVPTAQGEAARDHWIKENQCASTSAPAAPAPCVTYDGCSAGHPVTWCSPPGGHSPPSFATRAIWDFFQAN